MAKTDADNGLPGIGSWLVEMLRITCFPTDTGTIDVAEWWTKALGEAPESTTMKPKEGAQLCEGPLGTWRLRVSMQPGRVDWTFAPGVSDQSLELLIPALSPFPKASEEFLAVADKWFAAEACPQIRRLAFGANLLQSVESGPDGYRLASKYLKRSVKIDAEGSRDLLYRINRRKPSALSMPGLEINRLTTWSVVVLKHVAMMVEGEQASAMPVAKEYALRLELDINTTQEFRGPFGQPDLAVVLRELVDCAEDVGASGDIP